MSLSTKSSLIYRGNTPTHRFVFTNPDGTAYDLTGATLQLLVKNGLGDDDTDAIIDRNLTLDVDPTTGIARITYTAVETAVPESYIAEVRRTLVGGALVTAIQWQFVIARSAIKDS